MCQRLRGIVPSLSVDQMGVGALLQRLTGGWF
jgi:hypothetical protein